MKSFGITLIAAAGWLLAGCNLAASLQNASDRTPPVISLFSISPEIVRAPYVVEITLDEPVTDFGVDRISVTNATLSDFIVISPLRYTVLVTPVTDGEVSVAIEDGTVADTARNMNVGETLLLRIYDATPPTVTIDVPSPVASDFNFSPLPATATFSEDVEGFDLGRLSLTNATAANLAGGPTVFTFDVTPSTEGPVTVSIAAGEVVDRAGNPNVVSNPLSKFYDVNPPSCSFTAGPTGPTNVVPPTFAFDCTDDRAIIATECRLDGGAWASCLTSSFHALIGLMDGSHSLDVRATDLAGNAGTADSRSFTLDGVGPIVVLSTTAPDPHNGAFAVEARFDSDVTGLAPGDFVVTNAIVGSFIAVDAMTYTFLVTPIADGTVTVQLPAGSAFDAAANGNSVSNILSRTHDATRPTVVLNSGAGAYYNSSPLTITATFSEDVANFALADVSVTNGSLANLTGGPRVYAFELTPAAEGESALSVTDSAATDAAGNASRTSAPFSRHYDVTPPACSIAGGPSGPTNDTTPSFTFTCSDDKSLGGPQCRTDGGAWGACTGATTYDAASLAEGGHSIEVRATDSAGNIGAAVSRSFTVDTTQPGVTLSSSSPDPLNAAFVVDVEFDSDVTGLTATDFSVTNGTAGPLIAIDGDSYSLTITPASDGPVSVQLPAARAVDSADNGNNASNTLTRTYDSTRPTVVLASAAPAEFKTATISVTATFSEPVTGFALSDLTLTNAAATALAGGPSVYTFTITPILQGALSVTVANGAASDAATNPSQASAALTRTYDTVLPTCSVTGGPTGWINTAATSMTFSCADDRSLASVQCRVDAGAWGACTSGSTHALSGLADGAHAFEVRGVDSATNVGLVAARSFSVDTSPPTVGITVAGVGSENPSFTFNGTDGASGVTAYSCQLDGIQSWTNCASGKSYSSVGPGSHLFRVIAIDGAGNASTQATYAWTNGGWTNWSGWTDVGGCTATCGGGNQRQDQSRSCTNPTPANGGYACDGPTENTQYVSCNTQPCCSGYAYGGYCYYKASAWTDSCDTICASRGGCNLAGTQAANVAGTCAAVAGGLGYTAVVGGQTVTNMGCAIVSVYGYPYTGAGADCGTAGLASAWFRICACGP